MSGEPADSNTATHRSSNGCLCCGSVSLYPEATLAELLAPQGWLYVEVPDEMWLNHTFPGTSRDRWLGWIVRRRRLLIAADTLSTACRILVGFLPPFGFIPMREHLQYFSDHALVEIVRRAGLRIVRSGRNSVGQIYVVATNAPRTP